MWEDCEEEDESWDEIQKLLTGSSPGNCSTAPVREVVAGSSPVSCSTAPVREVVAGSSPASCSTAPVREVVTRSSPASCSTAPVREVVTGSSPVSCSTAPVREVVEIDLRCEEGSDEDAPAGPPERPERPEIPKGPMLLEAKPKMKAQMVQAPLITPLLPQAPKAKAPVAKPGQPGQPTVQQSWRQMCPKAPVQIAKRPPPQPHAKQAKQAISKAPPAKHALQSLLQRLGSGQSGSQVTVPSKTTVANRSFNPKVQPKDLPSRQARQAFTQTQAKTAPPRFQEASSRNKGSKRKREEVDAVDKFARTGMPKQQGGSAQIPAKNRSKIQTYSPKQLQAKHQHNSRDGFGAQTRKASAGTPKGAQESREGITDCFGRQWNMKKVVVNFANVGFCFGSKVLNKGEKALFEWEGVRRCVRYLKHEMHLQVTGVIPENFKGADHGARVPLPEDIKSMCETVEETPRLDRSRNHQSADDEMTIKCAYRRACRFMDNDNYSEWMVQLTDAKARTWLQKHKDFAHMRYYFDKGVGTFDVLGGNYPTTCLAQNEKVAKWDLENMGRG